MNKTMKTKTFKYFSIIVIQSNYKQIKQTITTNPNILKELYRRRKRCPRNRW